MDKEIIENAVPADVFSEIIQGAAACLRFLAALGAPGFDLSAQSLAVMASWEKTALPKAVTPDIFNNFIKCRPCALSEKRQWVIRGMGNPDARLVVIGGVPEAEDMQTGNPYSGGAGALLDKILAAMSLSRNDVYITFAVKCAMPDAAKPGISVVNTCRAYLRKELMRLHPDVICVFGEIAAMSLLETATPLARLRGRFHDYRGILVMPTHAPEYLLKNPDAKREAWEDIKQVMGRLTG